MDNHSSQFHVDIHGMHSVYIHGERSCVITVADEKTINNLTHLCHNFLTISPFTLKNRGDNVPTIIGSDIIPSSGEWEHIVYTSNFGPDRNLFVDHTTREILISESSRSWRTLQMLRMIRNILRWEAFVTGDLFLHGGLVDMNGIGVAYVGGKKSGKTSSILAALLTEGSRLVSNDDLTIREKNGQLIAYGWPRTINVRRDTIRSLQKVAPGLLDLIPDAKHPANIWPGPHNEGVPNLSDPVRSLPHSLWIYPAELTKATRSMTTRTSEVKVIIFPQFDDSVENPLLEQISPTEAAELITPHVEERAVKSDPFLRAYYIDTGKESRAAMVEKLLCTASFFRLQQNMSLLQEAAQLVRKVII